MSRKGKKRSKGKFRPPVRPPGPLTPGMSATATGVAQPGSSPPRSVSQARVGGDQALVRSVEMSLGARNQFTKVRGGRYIVESADPSIPLDRVPYFTKDLVRLVVVGVAMVVLLGIGSVAVPMIVK
ncbi:MAG: hypothetical protein ACREOY_14830 [Candidatus Dormibacteraceae bacterium]